VVAVAQLMTVLDLAVVFVALPSMQDSLGFATVDRQWVVAAYAISFGGLLLLGGRLVDYFGRRRMFIGALLGFSVVSTLGGLAWNGGSLFAARALQGALAAVIAPAVLSLVSVTFTEARERAKAFAVYGMVSGSGAAIGLILGGVLTQYGSWRWCLLINTPLALFTATAAAIVLRPDPPRPRSRYDIAGAVTATAGLALLVEGFTLAATEGWASVITLSAIGAAAALLAGFVWLESHSRNPLLPLRIVTEPHRGLLYLAAVLANAAQLSMFLFLTYYFQTTNGYSAVQTGFAFLPFALAVISTANLTTLLLGRFGPMPVMLAGAALGVAGLFALSTLRAHASYPTRIMVPEIIMGVAVALALFPLNNVVLRGIHPADAGVASAVLSTTQQMGASMGAALLNTIFTTTVAAFLLGNGGAALEDATMHGYRMVFRWESAMFAGTFLLMALAWRFLPRGDASAPAAAAGAAEPARPNRSGTGHRAARRRA
jgi:EmrB/QacA subfamily drug resistance transporter